MNTNHPTHLLLLASASALLAGAGLLGGCRGEREDAPPRQFFPDMDDSPKWEPQGESQFFADGRMMRQPVAGTVPFGRQGFEPGRVDAGGDWSASFAEQRADLLKEDKAFYTGKQGDGTFLVTAPVRFSKADLLRGQERFNISCASCHNYNGDGQGTVGQQWSYPLPNFHDDKYVDPKTDQGKDGYLFQVIRKGVPGGTPEQPDYVNSKMPGYAHALTYEDSWRIVAYIRALQASRRAGLGDVPADKRDDVQKQMNDLKAKAQAASPATGGAQ